MSANESTFDPLQPHSHEPNPAPPSDDPTIRLVTVNGRASKITVTNLQKLPKISIPDCYIVSTGHGTSGPFLFGGVTLLDFINSYAKGGWTEVEVISEDGFGNRVYKEELLEPSQAGAILLAYEIDEQALTREQGLVRLIVPSERDDALRQVKWVSEIRLKRP